MARGLEPSRNGWRVYMGCKSAPAYSAAPKFISAVVSAQDRGDEAAEGFRGGRDVALRAAVDKADDAGAGVDDRRAGVARHADDGGEER